MLLWMGVLLLVAAAADTALDAASADASVMPHSDTSSQLLNWLDGKQQHYAPSCQAELQAHGVERHTIPCGPEDTKSHMQDDTDSQVHTASPPAKKRKTNGGGALATNPAVDTLQPSRQEHLREWSAPTYRAFIQRIRERAQYQHDRKRKQDFDSFTSPYLLELNVTSPKDAKVSASLYMWMAPRTGVDKISRKGQLYLADLALSIIGYRVGDKYWWFIEEDRSSLPVLPTPLPIAWERSSWDPVIKSVKQGIIVTVLPKWKLSKDSVHKAVLTFSQPPRAPDASASLAVKARRHQDLLILANALGEAVKFQCMETLVREAWMQPPIRDSVQQEQFISPTSMAVSNINDRHYEWLSQVTIGQVLTNWGPVIEAAELREKKLVYVGINNEQVAAQLGLPPTGLEFTLNFAALTAGETCSDACKRLPPRPRSPSYPWRPLMAGQGGELNNMCLGTALINGRTRVWAAGSVPHGVAGGCQVASTPGRAPGGSLRLAPATSPSGLTVCVCTTCGGRACDPLFWLPGKSTACPYRPPLHFTNGDRTFFNFPGATGQQPEIAGLQGGNWCRFKPKDSTWVVGYVRGGACQGSNGQSSTNFDTFCPFLVKSCVDACNVKGLVNAASLTTCSCDYWCQLYGDCCVKDEQFVRQCRTMAPSLDFGKTRNCSARTGIALEQNPCGTFRPAGCWCDKFCAAARDCCDNCPQECGASTCGVSHKDQPPSNILPTGQIAIDRDVFPLPTSVNPFFTRDAKLLEREEACANAMEGQIPLSPTIQIQVVYVSVKIGDQGGIYNAAYGSLAIAALNAAYARAGFYFNFAANIIATFNSLHDVKAGDDVCGYQVPIGNCQRCKAYGKAPRDLQNLPTLFIYGVPASIATPDPKGSLLLGEAIPPQWLAPPRVRHCVDGFWGFEPGVTQGWGTITPDGYARTVVHEVGHWFGLSHTWAQSTGGNQKMGCEQSARYNDFFAVNSNNSDAVRDTPPQPATAAGDPIFFECDANGISTTLQSCTTAVGYSKGDKYYANFVNVMSYNSNAHPCRQGLTLTPGQYARARCIYECYRQSKCFIGSFTW